MEPLSLINPGHMAKYEYRMTIPPPAVERYAPFRHGSALADGVLIAEVSERRLPVV